MKKKVIAILLSLSMIVGIMPTLAFATSGETTPVSETTAPTESTPAACEVCQKEDCTTEHKKCETCQEYDCTRTHVFCETCQKYDCGGDHNVEPVSEPELCTTCGKEDCSGQHENWCKTCKKDNCGIDHNAPKTCETCGQTDCGSQHENWCDICRKDDCGKTHVFCETCGIYDCGIVEHAIMPADEGEDAGEKPEPTFYDSLLAATKLGGLYESMTKVDNAVAIAGLSTDELTQLKAKAQELYNIEANKTFTDDYQLKTLNMKIDSLIEKGGNQELKEHLAKCNCQPENGFHSTECPAYIAPPTANVTERSVTIVNVIGGGTENLSYAMQFATRVKVDEEGNKITDEDDRPIPDYTDLQLAYYGDWIADFVVYTNKDIVGKDAFLAGQYDLYNKDWLCIKLDADATLPGNTPIQLIKTMFPDLKITFDALLDFIPEFNCGIWVSDELRDFKVTVELRLYPTDASGNYNENIYHTLADIDYQPETATFTYLAGANGSVSTESETVTTLGEISGSIPTANEGYHFAGWYSDPEYKNAVPSGWIREGNKLVPGTNASGTYDSATYYALFEEQTTTVIYTVVDTATGSVYFEEASAAETITDTFGKVTGSPKTATAKPVNGYMFVGWYTDEACTKLHSKQAAMNSSENGTFYAKFIKDHATVTVTKTIDKASSSDQSFILNISGTIYNNDPVNVDAVIVIPAGQTSGCVKVVLPVSNGEYSVSDQDGWNWRYKVKDNAAITIKGGDSDGALAVTSTLENSKWFADSYIYAYKKES